MASLWDTILNTIQGDDEGGHSTAEYWGNFVQGGGDLIDELSNLLGRGVTETVRAGGNPIMGATNAIGGAGAAGAMAGDYAKRWGPLLPGGVPAGEFAEQMYDNPVPNTLDLFDIAGGIAAAPKMARHTIGKLPVSWTNYESPLLGPIGPRYHRGFNDLAAKEQLPHGDRTTLADMFDVWKHGKNVTPEMAAANDAADMARLVARIAPGEDFLQGQRGYFGEPDATDLMREFEEGVDITDIVEKPERPLTPIEELMEFTRQRPYSELMRVVDEDAGVHSIDELMGFGAAELPDSLRGSYLESIIPSSLRDELDLPDAEYLAAAWKDMGLREDAVGARAVYGIDDVEPRVTAARNARYGENLDDSDELLDAFLAVYPDDPAKGLDNFIHRPLDNWTLNSFTPVAIGALLQELELLGVE